MNARPVTSSRPPGKSSSKPPRTLDDQLQEALADAEKMARRVEHVAETDPFAAALLAAEYLARVQQRSVNPLDQRGRTDAWTSAFVRLRLMADKASRHPEFERIGALYLAARAEERRLEALLGRDASMNLAKARATVRSATRARSRDAAGTAIFVAAACAAGVSFFRWGVPIHVAAGAAALFVAIACAWMVDVVAKTRRIARAAADVTAKTRGLTERAAFETSATGRPVLDRVQREHPLLVKVGVTRSSIPPADAR